MLIQDNAQKTRKAAKGKKPQRSKRGEGSVYFERGKYIGMLRRNGWKHSFSADTEAAAWKRLGDFKADITGGLVDLATGLYLEDSAVEDSALSPQMTVGELGKYWLEQLVQREVNAGRFSPLTLQTYRWGWSHVAKRPLAKVRLDKLSRGPIERWWRQMEDEHVGEATRAKAKVVLGTVLQAAVLRSDETGLQVNHAWAFVIRDREKYETPKKAAPDAAAAKAISAQAAGSRYALILELGWRLGARRQELAGVQLRDFDFETGLVTFRRRVNRVNGQGVVVRPGVKMGRPDSTRVVPFDRDLWRQLLHDHRLLVLQFAAQNQKHWNGPAAQGSDAWLFPTRYGTPTDPNDLLRVYKEWVTAAGVPEFTLHKLRHDFVSIHLNAGKSVWEVAQLAGHSSTQVTEQVYGHVDHERMHDFSGGLADVWLAQARQADVAARTG